MAKLVVVFYLNINKEQKSILETVFHELKFKTAVFKDTQLIDTTTIEQYKSYRILYYYNLINRTLRAKCIQNIVISIHETVYVEVPGFSLKNEVIVAELSPTEIKNKVVEKYIELVNKCNASKKQRINITETVEKQILCNYNIDEELTKRNLIKMSDVRGRQFWSPELTALKQALLTIYHKTVLEDFQQVMIPKTISFNAWLKSGHLSNFGNELYYVSRMNNRNDERFNALSNYMYVYNKIPHEFYELLSHPSSGLTYAQCIPMWPCFENKTINHQKLPIKIFDDSGPSFRYEGNAIHSIQRLDEFHRLEQIFIEKKDKLNDLLQIHHKRICEFLNKIEITYRVVQVDSWLKTHDCCAHTVDYEGLIPWKNTWLEFLNYSNNSVHYIEKFNIHCTQTIATGCSGLGIDRIVYCFLCQKGFDVEKWPTEVQNTYSYKSVNNEWLL